MFFFSGTDTGIGKTVAVGLASRWLLSRGVDHVTVKLVQTGCDGFSEDLLAHRAIAGLPEQPEDREGLTAPQIFRFPASPALAAALQGAAVDTGAIDRAVAECRRRRSLVLVEGAGGLLVPLSDSLSTADFVARRGWPLVLVATDRLGSINHILLSLEAAERRGISVAGVVLHASPGEDPRIADDAERATRRALAALGVPDSLVRVPRIPDGATPPAVDFSPVFGPVHG